MTNKFHSLDNLYTYIQNAKKIDFLESQIAIKEDDLNHFNSMQVMYETLGLEMLVEDTVKRYNKIAKEKIKLQLKKNLVEREMLEFELGVLEEE